MRGLGFGKYPGENTSTLGHLSQPFLVPFHAERDYFLHPAI
jgi:hypothetical protein